MNLRSEEITKISSKSQKKCRKTYFLQRKFANNPPSGIGSVIDGEIFKRDYT